MASGREYGPWPDELGEYDFPDGGVECCTDDRKGGKSLTDEFINTRKVGCLDPDSCAQGNNRPEFSSDSTDRVCCNDPDDAVFRGRCFEDKQDPNDPSDIVGGPYYYSSSGGGKIEIAEDVGEVPNLVANKNVWYDCDSDFSTCEGLRSDGLCELNWTKSGEYPKGRILPEAGRARRCALVSTRSCPAAFRLPALRLIQALSMNAAGMILLRFT